MATEAFNVNQTDVVELTNKLEKLHKSSFPVAVRSSLNDAAFDAKLNQVEKAFQKQFIIRKKTFIKSHTAVNKSSNTFDLNKMQSEMGIIKGKSTAGDLLLHQEFGGTIPNRENVPMDEARIGKSKVKSVSKRNYINRVKPKRSVKRGKNQEFIRTAIKAGSGEHIIYGDVLYKIRSIKKRSRDKIFIKTLPLYSVKKNRSVQVKPSPFIEVAGKQSAKRIPEFYGNNALKQFKKHLL